VAIKARKSLPEHIIDLRDKGFFAQSKIPEEVHQKLQTAYPCEQDRVAMALLRLAAKRELRKAAKTSGNKKHKAYVW
jgi:hypothetical protein